MVKVNCDMTAKRLFFQLLHERRFLQGKNHFVRKAVLLGMLRAFNDNIEDFRIADRMRDTWKCEQAGERR
jgi:hypothetical protein